MHRNISAETALEISLQRLYEREERCTGMEEAANEHCAASR
jgi:hypothetical protein